MVRWPATTRPSCSVGAFLLGVAYRGESCRRRWQPYAAAVVLALGTGYRQDIGTFWLAVFLIILWQHRWRRAVLAGLLFTILNLAWLAAMLYDNGGWSHYRASSAEYAYQCGYLNSIWHLGVIDAPVRYCGKAGDGPGLDDRARAPVRARGHDPVAAGSNMAGSSRSRWRRRPLRPCRRTSWCSSAARAGAFTMFRASSHWRRWESAG